VHAEDLVGTLLGATTLQYADLTSSPICIERVTADMYKRKYHKPEQRGEVALYVHLHIVVPH